MLPSNSDNLLARGISAYRRSSTGTKAMIAGGAAGIVGGGAYLSSPSRSAMSGNPMGMVAAGSMTYGAAGLATGLNRMRRMR